MSISSIFFHSEYFGFKLQNAKVIRSWLYDVAKEEKRQLDLVNIIFCEDSYLLAINKEYLKHNYYTDIITFDYSEPDSGMIGDIFISIDRAKENAKDFREPFRKEILRLMVHGLLHLIGYNDKAKKDKEVMTLKENYYLKNIAQEIKKNRQTQS